MNRLIGRVGHVVAAPSPDWPVPFKRRKINLKLVLREMNLVECIFPWNVGKMVMLQHESCFYKNGGAGGGDNFFHEQTFRVAIYNNFQICRLQALLSQTHSHAHTHTHSHGWLQFRAEREAKWISFAARDRRWIINEGPAFCLLPALD